MFEESGRLALSMPIETEAETWMVSDFMFRKARLIYSLKFWSAIFGVVGAFIAIIAGIVSLVFS